MTKNQLKKRKKLNILEMVNIADIYSISPKAVAMLRAYMHCQVTLSPDNGVYNVNVTCCLWPQVVYNLHGNPLPSLLMTLLNPWIKPHPPI